MNKTKILANRLVILTALSLGAVVSALAQEAAPSISKLDEYLSAAAKQGFTGSALVARDGKVDIQQRLRNGQRRMGHPEHAADQIPSWLDHQTVHRGGDPVIAGTRQAQRARPCLQIRR